MAAIDRLRQVVRHVAAVAVAPEGSSENQVLAGVDDGEIVRAGEAQALAAPNRGPLLVHGKLNPAIAPLFEEWGFFVLEGVIGDEELEDLRADIGGLIDRAPVSKGSELDKFGRPAEKAQWNIQPPLSDPNGGRGRSPAKGMRTPTPAADAPKEVPMSLQSYLPHSEAGLRLYAHPGLLALAAAVNGNTFCPFSESIQIKLPGLGPSVTWHQDGTTHWEQPEPEHGFNFMCQLYGSTAENGVWVVPKSHRVGRIDIPELVQQHGDRIPGALPMVCKPGDVVIANRNCLHASFPNVSKNLRITLNFGFHKREAVLGARDGFDEERIYQRSRMIPLAMDARAQRFPDEKPYALPREHPCAGRPERYTGLEASREVTQGPNLGI